MKIQKILRDKGYRVTNERIELAQALDNKLSSAEEILRKLLDKGVSIDLTSVYRTLDLFVDLGIAHMTDLGEGKKRYELADKDQHHHHLVCNNCGIIEDIFLKEESFVKEVALKSKFSTDHHHLEFFGLCRKCQ